LRSDQLQELSRFFDTCGVRAYWLLSFLPAESEHAYPSLAHDTDAPIIRPPAAGLLLFVDTDDDNVWALMHENDPNTTTLLARLNGTNFAV